nr:HAMP domain-containing sensor histidine kinase [Glycomyces amatae]
MGFLLHSNAAQSAVNSAEEEGQSLVTTVISGDRAATQAAVETFNVNRPYPATVFWPDGTLIGAEAPRSNAVEYAALGNSFSAKVEGGREILFAVGLAEGVAVVRVHVDDDELTEGVGRSWALIAVIAVALLAFGLIAASLFAGRLLVPLNDLAAVSHRLANGDLEARADAAGPSELRNVGTALNTLADRIKDLLEAERERVADLSHRLRTPLTVLKLETEALGDHAQREPVEQAVAEVERAVNAAIQDARNPAEAGTCDAAAVVAERVEFWSALAEDTARECRVRLVPGPLPVRLSAADLAAAMDSLLANVFAHTPDGTAFEVRLAPRYGGGATVDVADEGPGLPNLAVFNRGRSEGGSTGLGLDIARRAAAASGGQLVFGQGPGGVGALIRLELG